MYVYLYFKGISKKKGSQVLQCPELTNPEWGTVNITQNARGLFTALYKCMPQHSISGDRLRFCSQTSGQWSGSTPRCLPSKTFNHSLYVCMHACMRACVHTCIMLVNIKLLFKISSACSICMHCLLQNSFCCHLSPTIYDSYEIL